MKIHNAFRIGLVGTLGVGVGLLILMSIASLSTIIAYIGAALFLALGLDPAISWLERRGLPRWSAILIVMTAVGLVVAALVLAVVPIVVDQVSQLVDEIPGIVARVNSQDWIESLQEQFPQVQVDEISRQVTTSVNEFVTNPEKLSELAGGVIWSLNTVHTSETLARQIQEDTKSVLGKDAHEAEEATQLVERIEHTTREFFKAATVAELSKMVRHPERVMPLMAEYYATHRIVPQRIIRTDVLQPLTLGDRLCREYAIAVDARQTGFDLLRGFRLLRHRAQGPVVRCAGIVAVRPMPCQRRDSHRFA